MTGWGWRLGGGAESGEGGQGGEGMSFLIEKHPYAFTAEAAQFSSLAPILGGAGGTVLKMRVRETGKERKGGWSTKGGNMGRLGVESADWTRMWRVWGAEGKGLGSQTRGRRGRRKARGLPADLCFHPARLPGSARCLL